MQKAGLPVKRDMVSITRNQIYLYNFGIKTRSRQVLGVDDYIYSWKDNLLDNKILSGYKYGGGGALLNAFEYSYLM